MDCAPLIDEDPIGIARQVMERRWEALRALADIDRAAKLDAADTIMEEDAEILKRLAK